MKNQKHNFALFQHLTGGRTTVRVPGMPDNAGIDVERMAAGYQPSRTKTYRFMGR